MPNALLSLLFAFGLAQAPPSAPAPSIPAARFAGVWVGTQGWAIANPPPGARPDQPVTLTLQVVDGKVSGVLTPFLGGEEGATLVNTSIEGDELHATAVVGAPRPPAGAAGRGARRGPPNWKDAVAVTFVFKNDGVRMKGSADVTMSEVPWTKFSYDLGKRRTRY